MAKLILIQINFNLIQSIGLIPISKSSQALMPLCGDVPKQTKVRDPSERLDK